MNTESNAQNSDAWKLWHGFNYFLGGGTFLIGSLILFSLFSSHLDVPAVSGWLYSIGSATFTIADITEWASVTFPGCRFKCIAVNFFLNVIASILYLIGSICFIPQVGQLQLAMDIFILGSALIVIAQTWKILRTLNQKGKSWRQSYRQDPSGLWIDVISNVGGLMYLVGTFIYKQISNNPELSEIAASIYCFGGLCFFTSSVLLLNKYFCEKKKIKEVMGSNYTIVTDF